MYIGGLVRKGGVAGAGKLHSIRRTCRRGWEKGRSCWFGETRVRSRGAFVASTEYFAGFSSVSSRYATVLEKLLDGTEQAPTSKPSSRPKKNCGKMNASFAVSRTRYRKQLLSWIPLVLRSTPINRSLTIRATLRKTRFLRTFASEPSTH